jgi:hypothetical protein
MYIKLLHGTKKEDRPRKRWIDDVEQDLRTMGVRGWRTRARDRQEWRRVTREAKSILDCSACE